MTQDLRLGVNVSDSGTTSKTEQAIDELRQRLAEAKAEAKAAAKELKALNAIGGTAGSRNMSSVAANSIQQYGTQRGAAALTGAAGRDFANQAQGLDGLVRLYATYAANVFALGAAFRGLSTAMDTTNMIKGLDQLGAAVGRNLGGLSKRFVELSGGAISMREAMQAVAQTSSGGMSTQNIERLAKVASSASVALGVSMPDAVNRLSRGITKLEPELLDELGIMTRLEPAMNAYARTLGKATSQLTDFERRQAFANAVLLEGEMKFGAISDIAANPYDKLLASLKDVLQVGAAAINTVLGPLASLLASSPTALSAGIAALAGMILKQAVPAIGQIKQGLAEAAESAAEIAKTRADEAIAASAHASKAILDQAELLAEKEINIQDAAQKRIEAIRGKSLRETSLAYKLVNKAVEEVSEKEIQGALKHADVLDRKGRKEEAKAYREITSAIQAQQVAETNLAKKRQESIELLEKQAKGGSKTTVFGITQALALEAQNTAIKKNIISNAAYNASLIGISRTWTLLKAEIDASSLSLNRWQMFVLKAQAGAAIFAGVMSTLTSAFFKLTNAIAVIGTAFAIFSLLDNFLSTNAKQAQEFSSALDEAADSSKNLHRTLDQLNKTMGFHTIEGIMAMAQALDNLSASTTKAVATATKNKEALTGIWSIVGNEISKIWGGDIESKLAASLAQSVQDVLELVEHTGLKDEARMRFKSILGIDSLDTSSIQKGLANLSKTGQVELQKFTDSITLSMNNSSSRLQSFRTATDASTRAYQQFIQATANISPLFRVGAALENLGVAMFDISREAELGVEEINAVITHLSKVPEAGAVFGKQFIDQLVDVREEFVSQGSAIQFYKKQIIDLEKTMSKHTIGLPRNYDVESDPNNLAELGFDKQKDSINLLRKLVQEKKAIEQGLLILESSQQEKARKVFLIGMDSAFTKGAELLRVSLGLAMERGALAIGKASLAGLTGENRANAENALAKKELDIQLKAIDTNIDLILSQELLRAAIDESTATTALLSGQQSGKSGIELKMLENNKEIARIVSNSVRQGGIMPTPSGDSDVDMQVKARSVALQQKLAEQRENKILVKSQMEAQGIAGGINTKIGRLEDTQRLLTLENQLMVATTARAAAVAQIVTVANEYSVIQQTEVERQTLLNKQASEMAAIENSIAIAQSEAERVKQEGFKQVIAARHEQELSTIAIVNANKLLVARNETLQRQVELTKVLNEMDFVAGFARLDVLNAENAAYTQLFGIVENYGASQNAVLGTQKAQLDFIKLISNAQLDFSVKEAKAREQLAALDPSKDAEAISVITDELARQEKLTKATIANAKSNLTAQSKILEINKKAAIQQATYNRLLNNSNDAAASLAGAFGQVGEAVGGVVQAFAQLTVNTDKGVKAIEILLAKQAEMTSMGQDTTEVETAIGLQRQKNTQQQLLGFANMTSSAKMMFDEQSAGYQQLAALEKAIYIAHIAMTLKQMATDAIATIASLANAETRMGGMIVEAEVAGTTSILKALASVPPPFNFALAAVMAAVVAGLLSSIGGSSKVPSMPSGVSAEDAQSTQGTGQRFINGKLADVSSGALGNSTEKVEDIARSIDLIEAHTSLTSTFGQETLTALKAIEVNTKDLAASVFRSTSVGKLTSGFGTIEKSSTPATGLLSSFIPSTSKSVEIIDKGINVIGQFNDILKGTAEFLEYETTQTTKVKSGFLGIGGKTKIKINTQTKDLNDQAQEVVIDLFGKLANTAVTASKEILGQANTDVENILSDFVVQFKTSGLGLSGEEFAAAILAESSTVMNEIIGKALPQLDQFRQLGEGFSGTLVRLATTMGVVNEKTTKFGVDFKTLVPTMVKISDEVAASMANALDRYNTALNDAVNTTNTIQVGKDIVKQPTIDQIARLQEAEQELSSSRSQVVKDLGMFAVPLIGAVNDAQIAFTKAKLAVVDNINAQKDFLTVNKLVSGELKISSNSRENAMNGVTEDVVALYSATLDLNAATDSAVASLKNQAVLNLSFYDALVKSLGGIEAFVEKTDFFFENFYSESDQLSAKTKDVVGALQSFIAAGVLTEAQFVSLTDGIGNAREEYRQLVLAQNAFTDSGRSAINTLLTLAPAVVDITDPIADAANSITKSISEILDDVDVGVSRFSEILNDAILGRLEGNEIGTMIADTIQEGFFRAMSQSFVDTVTNQIVEVLISPILSGALNLSAVGYTAVSGLINGAVSDIVEKANTLASILGNPLFKQAMTTISTAVSQVVFKVNSNAKSVDSTFSSLKVKDYLEELNDLNKELSNQNLDNLLEAEQTRLDLLKEQADALKDSAERFRTFANNLQDFKDSLLTGAMSPLTPLQQYSTVKTQLEDLFQTASTSSNVEEKSAALEKIQEISSSFLNISRLVYSSGTQYTNDFNYVQSILDSLINTTGTQATIDEQQLTALNLQIKSSEEILESIRQQQRALDNIDNSASTIADRIAELNALLREEYQKGKTNIAESFTTLDRNLDNILSLDELKTAGIADDKTLAKGFAELDTNGDKQISRLEALTGAAQGTQYTLQSITPILEAINSGILDFSTGLDQIAKINQANITTGGSPISGSYTPSGGSGFGFAGSGISFNSALGSYISNNTVYGKGGQSIGLSQAKTEILNMANKINNGTSSAKELYNLFMQWGADSTIVAKIIGSTKQQVLDWFKSKDSSIPAFAKGINDIPEDMFAFLHKGERVLPEADNRELMQNLSNRNNTNQELIEEIRKLNARIANLEKAIVEGAVINAVATDRNTDVISSAVKDTASVSNHNQSIKRKVAVG